MEPRIPLYHVRPWPNVELFMGRTKLSELRISQFQLRPAPPPLLPADPRALAFFSPCMANSRVWGLLSCQIPWGGVEKRGQMPHPPSTLQHFSLIAQSSSAILSILMCDYLFQFNVFLCNSGVKSSGLAPGLANARPPGSANFANAPPPGLTRWANAPK